MPWKPTEPTFLDSSHEPITYMTTSIAEPISPAVVTNGTAFDLFDTPLSATETYRAPRSAGPAAARIELKKDAGAFADASVGIAVGGTVGTERSLQFRAVGLPFVATGEEPSVWAVLMVTDSGEAAWTA